MKDQRNTSPALKENGAAIKKEFVPPRIEHAGEAPVVTAGSIDLH